MSYFPIHILPYHAVVQASLRSENKRKNGKKQEQARAPVLGKRALIFSERRDSISKQSLVPLREGHYTHDSFWIFIKHMAVCSALRPLRMRLLSPPALSLSLHNFLCRSGWLGPSVSGPSPINYSAQSSQNMPQACIGTFFPNSSSDALPISPLQGLSGRC